MYRTCLCATINSMNGESPKNAPDERSERARRRLRGFAVHLMGYFIVMIAIVPINFMTTPDDPWFVLPMVGWGSALALHVAWVMGLFDGWIGK